MGQPLERQVATNRKARYQYEFLETLECGIVLRGTEVKSLRQGKCSIAEAHGHVRGNELFLVGANIPEYAQGNVHNHKPDRDRKLLAHGREIERWLKKVRERGITIVPVRVYFKGALVKVEMALARGKRLHDKRESQRQKLDKREMERALRRRR